MMVERVQQTLQRLIYNFITEEESLRYINVLQHLVDRYNKTAHSFTGYSPYEVESDLSIQSQVLIKFAEKYDKVKKINPQFAIGDTVRILLHKSAFHRS